MTREQALTILRDDQQKLADRFRAKAATAACEDFRKTYLEMANDFQRQADNFRKALAK